MTIHSYYQCDRCGNTSEDRDFVYRVQVAVARGEFKPPEKSTLHVCTGCVASDVGSQLTKVREFQVKNGKLVSVMTYSEVDENITESVRDVVEPLL